MPAGVTWGQYASFCIAAILSSLAGSQLVHQYYQPLKDLNVYVNRELKNLPDNVQAQIRDELRKEGVIKHKESYLAVLTAICRFSDGLNPGKDLLATC